jgi:hypothetical protein
MHKRRIGKGGCVYGRRDMILHSKYDDRELFIPTSQGIEVQPTTEGNIVITKEDGKNTTYAVSETNREIWAAFLKRDDI